VKLEMLSQSYRQNVNGRDQLGALGEDTIKMDLKEVMCDDVVWVHIVRMSSSMLL
jgi:hypothetical protein